MWATSDALKRSNPTSAAASTSAARGLAPPVHARHRLHRRDRSRRCTSCRVKSVPLQAGARAPAWSGELQRRQVAIEFPLSQLHPVLVPLGALEPDVVVEDVVTEGLADELGPGQLVDRLAKGLRERDDPALTPLLRREVVQVRLHRGGQLVAA